MSNKLKLANAFIYLLILLSSFVSSNVNADDNIKNYSPEFLCKALILLPKSSKRFLRNFSRF